MISTATFLKFAFLSLYLYATWHSLKLASLPSSLCPHSVDPSRNSFNGVRGQPCALPLIVSSNNVIDDKNNNDEDGNGGGGKVVEKNNPFLLELWIREHEEDNSDEVKHRHRTMGRHRWVLVPECSSSNLPLILPSVGRLYRIGLDRGSINNGTESESTGLNNSCTLTLPKYARQRGRSSSKASSVLEAKFVLLRRRQFHEENSDPRVVGDDINTGDTSEIIAEANFDLTTIVAKQTNDGVVHVPHYKYALQELTLRLVIDDSVYPLPAVRGDGKILGTKIVKRKKMIPQYYHLPSFYVDDTALLTSSRIEMAAPPTQSEHTHLSTPSLPPSSSSKSPLPSPSSLSHHSSTTFPRTTNLRIRLTVISPLRDVIHVQMENALVHASRLLSLNNDGDDPILDEVRYLLSDDRIYRLLLTNIVGTAHVWFGYLAFKDEVGFYVGRSSMVGVSFSSVLAGLFCEVVTFLYLCDNSNGTSWFVIFGAGGGVLASIYKVYRCCMARRTIDTTGQGSVIDDGDDNKQLGVSADVAMIALVPLKETAIAIATAIATASTSVPDSVPVPVPVSTSESAQVPVPVLVPASVSVTPSTCPSRRRSVEELDQLARHHDRVAFRYAALFLLPIVVITAFYSRLNDTQDQQSLRSHQQPSLYSWIISTLIDVVYTFGFVRLLPQLYVNHKLKSVSHLPPRAFLYKLFGTFVDDIFALLLDMPLKHRLMTLRDDVVLILLLIQRYWYTVDVDRVNEFGYAYHHHHEGDGVSGDSDSNNIDNNENIKTANFVKKNLNTTGVDGHEKMD